MTGFCVFMLIGLSTLVTPVLRVSDALSAFFNDTGYLVSVCVVQLGL